MLGFKGVTGRFLENTGFQTQYIAHPATMISETPRQAIQAGQPMLHEATQAHTAVPGTPHVPMQPTKQSQPLANPSSSTGMAQPQPPEGALASFFKSFFDSLILRTLSPELFALRRNSSGFMNTTPLLAVTLRTSQLWFNFRLSLTSNKQKGCAKNGKPNRNAMSCHGKPPVLSG